MSGHSKWSTIKRKKGAADAKRGQLFTRLAREIVIAAREGGGDPDSNFKLRLAVDKARASNMPKENIERAIRRGSGEDKDAAAFESVTYEGYAPHGVALLIQTFTDNRNRSVAEVRRVLTRHNGSLGEGGSVSWQFHRKAYFAVRSDQHSPEDIFEMAVEAGADDVITGEYATEIIAPVEAFQAVRDRLAAAGITPEEAELRMEPATKIELPQAEAVQVMKVVELLEELDDVQNVYSNLAITDEVMAAYEAAM
jgi:YebC/PmpR family DNA-binding regulatory protein